MLITAVDMNKKKMILNGQCQKVVQGLTLKRKIQAALTDENGYPWDDVCWHIHREGYACSQNNDFASFNGLLRLRWPSLGYRDICNCSVTSPSQPFEENMKLAWFPIPGLCKQLWPKETVWKTDNLAPSSVDLQFYTFPGEKQRWTNWRYKGIKYAYRPWNRSMMERICGRRDAEATPEISHCFMIDPLLLKEEGNYLYLQ